MNEDLHSNMVRFIISYHFSIFLNFSSFTFQYGQIYYLKAIHKDFEYLCIYIPIWLDLLLFLSFIFYSFVHIYIPIWLDLLSIMFQVLFSLYYYLHSNMVRFIIFILSISFQIAKHLHSNMVRFIIIVEKGKAISTREFTFQYGQIYYILKDFVKLIKLIIYIPIWLDLLLLSISSPSFCRAYLHSNMVRFIIWSESRS